MVRRGKTQRVGRRQIRKTLRRRQKGGAEVRYVISAHGFAQEQQKTVPENLQLLFFVYHGQGLACPNFYQTETCQGKTEKNVVELIQNPGRTYNYLLAKEESKSWKSGAVDCQTKKVIFDLETYKSGKKVELDLVLKHIKRYHDTNYPGQVGKVYCLFCRSY